MKKNNLIKFIFFITLITITIFYINFPAFADSKNFSANFDGGSVPTSINDLTNKSLATIISVIRIAGLGIAVTILTVIAIKYMIASPGDRADIKKHAVPFVIGAVVLFGTSGIISIIAKFAAKIS